MNNILVGVLIKNTHLEANTDKRMQSINCANYSLYLTWQSPEFDIWLAIGKKKKKKERWKEGKEQLTHFLWRAIILIRRYQLMIREGYWKHYQKSQWRNVVAKECFPSLKKKPNHKFNVWAKFFFPFFFHNLLQFPSLDKAQSI